MTDSVRRPIAACRPAVPPLLARPPARCCATSPRWPPSLGRRAAVLAVPEAARAAHAGRRSPTCRAVGRSWSPCRPATAAERLADDLPQYLAPDDGRALPGLGDAALRAGEPGVETMGRRLRRCCGGCRRARAQPRPASSWRRSGRSLQRLGPARRGHRARRRPARRRARPRRPGRPARRPGTAARTWSSTGARWPAGARSRRLPVHRRRARCASTCGATRSTGSASSRVARPALDRRPRRGRRLPGPRAAAHRRRPRAGPRELVGDEPWGREQWERLAEGLTFDGMESWLPWLADDEHLLTDLLPDDAQVCWSSRGGCGTGPPTCSPRRPTWPRTLARRGARERRDEASRASTCRRPPPGRRTRRGVVAGGRARVARTRRRSRPRRGRRRSATARPSSRQLARPAGRRLPGRGGRRRRRLGATGSPQLLGEHGIDLAVRRRRRRRPHPPRRAHRRGAAPRAASSCPERQAGRAGRGRPHRPPPGPPPRPAPPARGGRASSRTSSRATTSCTTTTASAATAAWSSAPSAASSATTCCSSTRAATSSTSRPTRSTPCATTSAARRRRCTASAAPTSRRPRAGCASAVREIAQELVVLYQTPRHTPRASPSAPTRRGRRSWRTASRSSRRPTSSRPSST